MSSFLFNTFINLYLDLVASYIRDLNPNITSVLQHHDEGLCLQTASSSNRPKVHTQILWHFSILRWSVVSSAFRRRPVNQREGQIITEYLAVLVESRIKCETTHTNPDILTEKDLMP